MIGSFLQQHAGKFLEGGPQKSASSLYSQKRFLSWSCFPSYCRREQWCIIQMVFPLPLFTGSHCKGSRRNIFPHIWLVRGTIVRNTFQYEKNKIIPKRQGLKTDVSNLKSDKDRNEALLPVLTMMGKSRFSKSGNNLHSL